MIPSIHSFLRNNLILLVACYAVEYKYTLVYLYKKIGDFLFYKTYYIIKTPSIPDRYVHVFNLADMCFEIVLRKFYIYKLKVTVLRYFLKSVSSILDLKTAMLQIR